MTSPHKAARTMLIATLDADPTIQSMLLIPDTVDQYKTFGAHVDPTIYNPYVVVQRYGGGLDNDAQSQAADMLWTVCGYTLEDEQLAEDLQEAIYNALNKKMPPAGIVSDWEAYHWIEEVWPYEDRDMRNNRPFFEKGAVYRIKIAECAG